MKRKFEETCNISLTPSPEILSIEDVLEADKRIVKYEVGDHVITSEFMHMGSKYYLKEFKTFTGKLEIIRESEMYGRIKTLDEEALSIFPECHLFPGKIVTKAVKGVPSDSLSSEIKNSVQFLSELNRVLSIFHRIGFAHGDFHGNNFYYDVNSGKIYVIDLGMSQFSNNIRIWSNNWIAMVPKEFNCNTNDRIFEFFKRLDIVNGFYVHSKGICNMLGYTDINMHFLYLTIFIKIRYGWKIVFEYKGKHFHKCIALAVAKSFETSKTFDLARLEEYFRQIGAIE
jgi:hypothetical protein